MEPSSGDAVAGEDYVATSGVLTFQPGETSKTVAVSIFDDNVAEYSEIVYLDIYDPVNATIADASDWSVIYDNDDADQDKLEMPVLLTVTLVPPKSERLLGSNRFGKRVANLVVTPGLGRTGRKVGDVGTECDHAFG